MTKKGATGNSFFHFPKKGKKKSTIFFYHIKKIKKSKKKKKKKAAARLPKSTATSYTGTESFFLGWPYFQRGSAPPPPPAPAPLSIPPLSGFCVGGGGPRLVPTTTRRHHWGVGKVMRSDGAFSECPSIMRPPLKKILFPVQRPGVYITAEWELFFSFCPQQKFLP